MGHFGGNGQIDVGELAGQLSEFFAGGDLALGLAAREPRTEQLSAPSPISGGASTQVASLLSARRKTGAFDLETLEEATRAAM